MNLDLVINQIRVLSPFFNGNVAGAAVFDNGIATEVWLPPPAAYVMPLDMIVGENLSMTTINQIITDRISVIVEFDNSMDRRGQAGVGNLDVALASLLVALYDWRPDSTIDNPGTYQAANPFANKEAKGFRLDGGDYLHSDRARLFYRWNFALDRTISDADGWQAPFRDLLTITGTIPTGDTIDPGLTFSTTLSQ